MCAHLLNGGPLVCDRTDRHDENARGGHVYTASAGSDLSSEGVSDE